MCYTKLAKTLYVAHRSLSISPFISIYQGFLSWSVDVAISSSQIRFTVFGDLRKWSSGSDLSRLTVYDEWYTIAMAEEASTIAFRDWKTCRFLILLSNRFRCWLFSLRKLEEVARGIHYIHSEGVVHGDLCGVPSPISILSIWLISPRTTFS